jgi:hypothetical protein
MAIGARREARPEVDGSGISPSIPARSVRVWQWLAVLVAAIALGLPGAGPRRQARSADSRHQCRNVTPR